MRTPRVCFVCQAEERVPSHLPSPDCANGCGRMRRPVSRRCSGCGREGHRLGRCPDVSGPSGRILAALERVPVGPDGVRKWAEARREASIEALRLIREACEERWSASFALWWERSFDLPTDVIRSRQAIRSLLWHPQGEWLALWALDAVTVADVRQVAFPTLTLAQTESVLRSSLRRRLSNHFDSAWLGSSKRCSAARDAFMDRVTKRGWSPLLEPERWAEWERLNRSERG